VLVIEDLNDSADSLALLLRLHGYDVELARTGLVAVEVALAWLPDVVLLDRPGYAVAGHLRADPRLAGVPVIAVTGDVGAAVCRRLAAAGIAIRLTKPVEPQELLNLLERIQRLSPQRALVR
jgi:CheY-like chemotaxis protein